MLRVVDVFYIKDYILDLVFNNGEKRRIDMLPHLDKGDMVSLKDKDMFQFGLTDTTIEWVNGIDLAQIDKNIKKCNAMKYHWVDGYIEKFVPYKDRPGMNTIYLSLLELKKGNVIEALDIVKKMLP